MNADFYNYEEIKTSLESKGWKGTIDDVKHELKKANNTVYINQFLAEIHALVYTLAKSIHDAQKSLNHVVTVNFDVEQRLSFINEIKTVIFNDLNTMENVDYFTCESDTDLVISNDDGSAHVSFTINWSEKLVINRKEKNKTTIVIYNLKDLKII